VDALLPILAALLAGYLCGALPSGLWLGRLARGIDVREHGSRNLGATNVYRVLGPPLGIATLVLDVLKGALPTWLLPSLPFFASFPGGREGCAVTVGLAAVAGHVWTCFAGFRGGKGVATTVGVLLAVAPLACAAFAAVFVLTLSLTRYVSLGSILGSVAFVAALLWQSAGRLDRPELWMGVGLAVLVIARHRENLQRLMRGEERRFAFRRGTGA
jgi:acyl phosphate:glycerol-3-phosphate acyltransferase